MANQAERNEMARNEVLALLAGTPSLSFQASTLQRRLTRESDLSLAEVVDALNFLHSAALVTSVRGKLGASLYWQITHEGTLTYERSF